jgi:hypothetical protein
MKSMPVARKERYKKILHHKIDEILKANSKPIFSKENLNGLLPDLYDLASFETERVCEYALKDRERRSIVECNQTNRGRQIRRVRVLRSGHFREETQGRPGGNALHRLQGGGGKARTSRTGPEGAYRAAIPPRRVFKIVNVLRCVSSSGFSQFLLDTEETMF